MRTKLLTSTSIEAIAALGIPERDESAFWNLRGGRCYGTTPLEEMAISEEIAVSCESSPWRIELCGELLWSDLGMINMQPKVISCSQYADSFLSNQLYTFSDFGHWIPVGSNDRCSLVQDAYSRAESTLVPEDIEPTCPALQKPLVDTLTDCNLSHSGWPGGIPPRILGINTQGDGPAPRRSMRSKRGKKIK